MDYDDNFNKAFQDHDLLETTSAGTGAKQKDIQLEIDPHCHVVERKRTKVNQTQKGKAKKLRKQDMYLTMYSSGLAGSNIRDAISGVYYKETVGTAYQDLFFKVTVATGDHTMGPLHLFYLSPEQYERHQDCVLEDYIKERWYAKSEYTRIKLRL